MPVFYTLEVRLLGITPRIWRRFAIRNTETFLDLHEAIQDAFDWENYHLFRFHAPDMKSVIAGVPDDGGFQPPDTDAGRIDLLSYFHDAPGKCLYQYDFGDDWWHEVELVETATTRDRFFRRLLDGGRAGPREDCGSTSGYERCVAAATGKGWKREYGDTSEREGLIEWLEGWNPEAFDLASLKKEFDQWDR